MVKNKTKKTFGLDSKLAHVWLVASGSFALEFGSGNDQTLYAFALSYRSILSSFNFLDNNKNIYYISLLSWIIP